MASPSIEGGVRFISVVSVNILCATVCLAAFMLTEQMQLNQSRLNSGNVKIQFGEY